MSRSPLPQRFGLDAARIRMPAEGSWPTVRAHLHERLARVTDERIDQMLAAGGYVDDDGVPLTLDSPFVAGQRIWFHRDLPDEPEVPFDFEVLHADERLVVIDKPHFLATIPRGQHIRQSALVKVRQRLQLPELSPAHRLDRATAGVLMFTTEPQWRGPYQNVFRDRLAHKTYLAVAPLRTDLALPATVRSNIVKERGVIQATQRTDLPPNAESLVELLRTEEPRPAAGGGAARLGLYRITPHTGRTHQIRLHMMLVGIPIVGDQLYPELIDGARDDFSAPLQLLAESLSFRDPIDGTAREFRSRRRLNQQAPHQITDPADYSPVSPAGAD